MNLNLHASVAAGALFLLLTAAPAVAQDKMTWSDGGLYGKLSAGLIIPTDTDVSNGTVNGITLSNTSAEISSKVGQMYSAEIGYNISDSFSIGVEGSYSAFDLDEISGSGTLTSGGNTLTVSGTASLEADIKSKFAMVNAVYTLPFGGAFKPYLGGGVGLVDWEITLDSATSGGNTLTCTSGCSADGTDLAAKGIVGAAFAVADNASAGIEYQYFWTDTGTAITDDVTVHAIQASLKFNF